MPSPCQDGGAAEQPEDVAAAVAFPASDESRDGTGIQLPVHLGTLAR